MRPSTHEIPPYCGRVFAGGISGSASAHNASGTKRRGNSSVIGHQRRRPVPAVSIEDSIDDAIRTTAAEAFIGWRTQLAESLRAHGRRGTGTTRHPDRRSRQQQLTVVALNFATRGLIVQNATSTVNFSRDRFPPPTGTRARTPDLPAQKHELHDSAPAASRLWFFERESSHSPIGRPA
ncbi:hypothetical protein GCM10027360_22390 [Amycolatopsis echigonensis]